MGRNAPNKPITLPVEGFVVQSIPFLLTLTALCLSIVATTSCRFFQREEGSTSLAHYGLFRYGQADDFGAECRTAWHLRERIDRINANLSGNQARVEYLSDVYLLAQAAGILAPLLGFTATLLLFLSFFLQRLTTKCVWRIALPILLCIAAVAQIMTFSVFGDEDRCKDDCPDGATTEAQCTVVTCTFSEGADRSLAAFFLYLLVGIGIIFYPRRSTPLFEFSNALEEPVASLETYDDMEVPSAIED